MKIEKKCFFSISLKNGIVITGNNPEEVKEFLQDLSKICSIAIKIKEEHCEWKDYVKDLKNEFDNAWITILINKK